MEINTALYIKLGEGGSWEKDSIYSGKIRIGWKNIPLKMLQNNEWNYIKDLHTQDQNYTNKGQATRDFNALQKIVCADKNTIFITFYSGKMYWCCAKKGSINEDSISKYMETEINWSSKSIDGKRTFEINHISGRLTKLRGGFKGTCCTIGNKLNEFDYLKQIINNIETKEYRDLFEAREALREALIPAIKNLMPKDFEILVDLIFRSFGWKRTSVLGESMKFFDIILEEPMKKTLHGVQIKSEAKYKTYEEYKKQYIENYQDDFSSFFFVVHTPDEKLGNYNEEMENINIFFIEKVADHAIDSGLISWIMDKAR